MELASAVELMRVTVAVGPFSDVPIMPSITCPIPPPARDDAVSVKMTFGTRFDDITYKVTEIKGYGSCAILVVRTLSIHRAFK